MILDRLFGIIAAVGFVFGVAAHIEFIAGLQAEPEIFDPPLSVFGVCALTAFVYLVLYAGWRDRLSYDNGELELWSVVQRLPPWAKVVNVILWVYVAAAVFVAFSGIGGGIVPASFHAQAVLVTLAAVFTVLSFVIAAYCLARV